jgi:hypothetical protein
LWRVLACVFVRIYVVVRISRCWRRPGWARLSLSSSRAGEALGAADLLYGLAPTGLRRVAGVVDQETDVPARAALGWLEG